VKGWREAEKSEWEWDGSEGRPVGGETVRMEFDVGFYELFILCSIL
jgi:hypothetical protein